MVLKAQLQDDLTSAMKARDQATTSTLRMLLAAVNVAAVAGDTAVELSDDQVLGVLRSEAKKRAESAEIYAQAGRATSADKERAELAVIERYLPAAPDASQLQGLVDAAVAAAAADGVSGPKAMGQVIKAVREQAGPAADGAAIAALVKAALA
ncbi:MAG TPA: GatB/YqeY domain-containing protein [Ilumatobacter sp.]|nr:GatB/YqeY domain-containing protein [Ilumatobacter sp.]